MNNSLVEKGSDYRGCEDQYHRAEFSISGLSPAYQFKIRNTDSTPMCVLIREDSNILPWLKVGSILNVKYYSGDLDYAPEFLDTEIRNITRDMEGRFKGHYLVGLEILRGQG